MNNFLLIQNYLVPLATVCVRVCACTCVKALIYLSLNYNDTLI